MRFGIGIARDSFKLQTAEALVGQESDAGEQAIVPRRSRPGPPSKIERQLDAINQLPKAEQTFVAKILDSIIFKAEMEAQHAT